MTVRVRETLGVLFTIAVVTGCLQAGNRPLVFPPAAELGDTVAMAIDSSHTNALDAFESHDLTIDNVGLEIRDKSSQVVLDTLDSADLRAVFDGYASATGVSANARPGLMLTAVLFDIPATLPVTPPQNVEILLLKDGQQTSPFTIGDLSIVGTNGSSLDFNSISEPIDLQPAPVLRLRGMADPSGVAGFDPAWQVASIEFFLSYPPWLANPRAATGNEAAGALALVGPEVSGEVRVVLIAPQGFSLGDPWPSTATAGEGPFLDIVFENATETEFVTSDFGIRDLNIYDPAGIPLKQAFTPMEDGTPFFELIVRANGS